MALFLRDYLADRGYQVSLQEVEPGRCQTIATLKGAGSGPSLMFNGHIDINSLTRGSKRDPWTPVVEGDRLYGHGVQNMKGGVAAMIAAAEAVRQAGVRLRGDLVLACVVGETQGGEGTHFLMKSGFRTDMAVLPEPFGLGNLVTVHGGIVHFAVHAHGVTGHVSKIEETVNAVGQMTRVIEALREVEFTYTPRADLPALPRLNVGSIIGGRGEGYVLTEPPYVPDLCTIIVDVHFVPGQTAGLGHRRCQTRAGSPEGQRPALRLRHRDPAAGLLQGLPAAGDGPSGRAGGRGHRPGGGQEPREGHRVSAQPHRRPPAHVLLRRR